MDTSTYVTSSDVLIMDYYARYPHNQSDFVLNEMKDLILVPYMFVAGLLVLALVLYTTFSLGLMLAVACGWGPGTKTKGAAPIRKKATNLVKPKHIAVIMDGNRRYGRQKCGGIVSEGHRAGGRTLEKCINWCTEEGGIEALTCYAFSTENWKRSQQEVSCLMNIFLEYCTKLIKSSVAKNIRVRVLASDPDPIPDKLKKRFREMEEATAHCTGLTVNLCVSYGSRSEITRACRNIAEQIKSGELAVEDVNENLISDHLLTGPLPNVDLMIRTSEIRLSNFLLWQLAYSELVFLPKHWPELTREDFMGAIKTYSSRQRRFGK